MFTREHLRMLDIINIYFKTFGGISSVVRILGMTENTTNVLSGNEIPDKGILVIEFSDETKSEIFVTVIKDFSETNTYTLFHEDALPIVLQEKIKKLNDILFRSELRKEFRYEIGLKNWQQFGLSKADCSFIDSSNAFIRCIINNASIHGVLITGTLSHVKIGEKVIFTCSFEETIKLSGIVINASSCGNGFFRYSLRFLEPLSIIWCNHIVEYGDYLENTLSY